VNMKNFLPVLISVLWQQSMPIGSLFAGMAGVCLSQKKDFLA